MEDLRNYIPKHKFDLESIDKLNEIKIEELKPILSELFEWIQDINWPIAKKLIEFLLKFGSDLIPEIKKTLKSDDDVFEYSCMVYLLPGLSNNILIELKEDLLRIAYNPTDQERKAELDLTAKDILKRI
jgi:hypothetical protein